MKSYIAIGILALVAVAASFPCKSTSARKLRGVCKTVYSNGTETDGTECSDGKVCTAPRNIQVHFCSGTDLAKQRCKIVIDDKEEEISECPEGSECLLKEQEKVHWTCRCAANDMECEKKSRTWVKPVAKGLCKVIVNGTTRLDTKCDEGLVCEKAAEIKTSICKKVEEAEEEEEEESEEGGEEIDSFSFREKMGHGDRKKGGDRKRGGNRKIGGDRKIGGNRKWGNRKLKICYMSINGQKVEKDFADCEENEECVEVERPREGLVEKWQCSCPEGDEECEEKYKPISRPQIPQQGGRSWRGKRSSRRGRPEGGKRPAGDKPEGPAGGRPERPAGDKPEGPAGGRPERPAGGRPERPAGDKPERPAGDKRERPAGDKQKRPERRNRRQ